MTTKETISKRVTHLLALADQTLKTRETLNRVAGTSVDRVLYIQLVSSVKVFLKDLVGEASPYFEIVKATASQSEDGTQSIRAILLAVQTDIEQGWLETTKGIIAAEVFTDFMEMAEHLLEQGYKDASAVIVGSVLEERLRSLCTMKGLPTTQVKDGKQVAIKAETLNAALCKAEVYNLGRQKSVTAWLDLRNNAAHGKYNEFTKDQVHVMYLGVLDFIGS